MTHLSVFALERTKSPRNPKFRARDRKIPGWSGQEQGRVDIALAPLLGRPSALELSPNLGTMAGTGA